MKMAIFRFEFKRNFWNKRFLALLFVLLCFNSVLIVRTIDVQDAKSWKKISSQVLKMEAEPRAAYIKQHTDQLNKAQESYFMSEIAIPNLNFSDTDQKAEENSKPSQLVLITDDLFTETGQFNLLQEQVISNENYSDFIDKTQTSTENDFAVFQTDDPYLKKVEQKTAKAYLPFQDREIDLINWRSFEKADNWRIGELLLCLLIIFQTYHLFYCEKDLGVLFLIYPLEKGRGNLIQAKMSVQLLTSLITSFVFALSRYFIFSMYYGAFDLTAPIQAVPLYQKSVLDINLIGLILLQVVIRALAVFLLAQVMLFISQFVRKISSLFLGLLLYLGIEYILYRFTLSFDVLNIFRYLNFFFFLHVSELFQTEFFINVFSEPISVRFFLLFVLPLCLIFMFIINRICFEKIIPSKTLTSKRKRKPTKISTSLIRHEMYKLFISSRGILILFIFAVLQAYIFFHSPINFLTNEQFYRQYMKKLEGEITTDKIQFICEERQKFDALHEELKTYQTLHEQGDISSTELAFKTTEISSQLIAEPAFMQVENNLRHLQQLELENRFLVYDSGFNRLAGLTEEGKADDILNSTMLVFCLILLLSEYVTKDYQIKLSQITRIYEYGREQHGIARLKTALFGASLAYILIYLPHLIKIITTFGMRGLFCHIEHLPQWQRFLSAGYLNKMPIIIYFFLLYLGRLFLVWLLATVIYLLAIWQQNIQRVMGITFLIFNLSLFISLLGFRSIDTYSFNTIFYGNPIYQKEPALLFVLPLWFLAFLFISIIGCLRLVNRKAKH